MATLEIYRNDNYVLNDAFDQAVMNLHIQKKQNGYKSFLICGCETGDGATTVSINLAASLASSGYKTVLIDGDMRKKNRYKRLNENATWGLSDFLMGKAQLDQVVYETTTENLSYVPCGELIDNPVRLLCSTRMNDAKEGLSKSFDFLIFDMPAANAAMDAKVIAVSVDAVILVSAIGDTSKSGVVDAANSFAEVKANLIGTIVNRVDMEQYASYHEEYDYFRDEKYLKNNKKKSTNKKNKKHVG